MIENIKEDWPLYIGVLSVLSVLLAMCYVIVNPCIKYKCAPEREVTTYVDFGNGMTSPVTNKVTDCDCVKRKNDK